MSNKKSEARKITLKYPAVCKSCKAELPVGSKVTWYPKGTVYGTTCHPSPFASAKPKVAKPKAAPAPSGQPVPNISLEQLAALNKLLSNPAHRNLVKTLLQGFK